MQHLAALSRRNLLKTGLFGGAAVVLGSVGLALWESPPRADTPKLRVLDAKEYAILCAIADRVAPALGPDAPGATALGTVATLDAMMESIDIELQKGIKLALRVFDNALVGALGFERVTPFAALSPEARDRVLDGWKNSRIGFRRTVFRALSGAVLGVYWGDERTWQRIGYGGPPDREGLRAAYAENLVAYDALRSKRAAEEI
ncbi:MAG: gluconate 2-dehydrogenase subunit 3 family protein [Polyangiales bacterium]